MRSWGRGPRPFQAQRGIGHLDLAALELGELLVLEQRRRLDEARRGLAALYGEGFAQGPEDRSWQQGQGRDVHQAAEILHLPVLWIPLAPADVVAVAALQHAQGR